MNPNVRGMERNCPAAHVYQAAFGERQSGPTSELILAEREVVVVPRVEYSGESRGARERSIAVLAAMLTVTTIW